MLILTLRTDQPQAIWALYDDDTRLDEETWQAHRQLTETIHERLFVLLGRTGHALTDIDGLAVYEGPGSFTGLRIGLSVANALAYGLDRPIAGAGGDGWAATARAALRSGTGGGQVIPVYGAPVHITTPKK